MTAKDEVTIVLELASDCMVEESKEVVKEILSEEAPFWEEITSEE